MTLALPGRTSVLPRHLVERPNPVLGRVTAVTVGLTVALVYARVSPIIEETREWPSFIVPACGVVVLLVLVSRLVEGWHPLEIAGPATVLVTLFLLLALAIRLPGLIHARDGEALVAGLVALLKDCFVALVIVFAAERTNGLRAAVWGIITAGTVLATLTIHKELTGAIENPYAGFSRATGALVSATENGIRYTGPFDDPNFYAQTLTVVVGLALARFWHTRSPAERSLMTITIGFCLVAIALTLSRGGLVATAIVIMTSVVFRFGRWALIVLVFAATAVTGVLPGSVVGRVASMAEAPVALIGADPTDPSIQGRTSETLVGIEMFLDNPALGVGLGNYEDNYLSYSSGIGLDPRRTERAAHNLFLEAAAELGLFGLVGFGVFVGAAVGIPGRVRRRLRQVGDRDGAATAEALQLAVIGYLITAVFLHDAFTRTFVVLTALAIGSVMLERAGSAAERGPARRLRVVQVIDSLTTGGAERLLAEFGARADRLELDLTVISLAAPANSPVSRDLRARGVTVRHAPSSVSHGLLDRTRFRKLRSLIDEVDPDVLHLHLETATILGVAIGRSLDVPTIVTLHNTEPQLGRGATVKRHLLRRRLRQADRLVAVGPSVAKAWRPRLGSDRHIDVVLNPARGMPRRRPKQVRSGPPPVPGDSPALDLICVGRLTAQKAMGDLVEAMAIVVAAHPRVRLRIVGDGPERASIEAAISSAGLGSSIDLLGVRDDIDRLLGESDLFVMASLWEGLPLAVLEALAAGLPVVGTAVGDVPEIVPLQAGTIVEPGKPAELAAAVIAYVEDPVARTRAAEAARHRIETRHDPNRWADRLNELYCDVGTWPIPIRERSTP